MVKLAEYSRTATFAWSHDRIPSLVTGTVSGTVDANFSSESKLELWSLLAADASEPTLSLAVDAKFNDLDWSRDDKIIAGALDNGVVELFSKTEDSLKSEGSFARHNGSVKTVSFNSKQNNVLASGGSKGEIFIWDLNTCLKNSKDYTPLTPGNATTPIDDVSSLAWNQSLAHVFASAGSTSYASIWDLKAKKEVIHLSYASPNTGLKPQLSVVEWHPANSTRVATATGSDSEPLILVWDLRNANTPLQVLAKGHTKGILSLDWCKQDSQLLLSSGRDNTIVLWNPEKAEELTQFPTRGNWCFKTKFAPEAPDLFASASFDNKIQVQTLQNLTNTFDQEQTATKQQESETDFWNHVSLEESNEKPQVMHLQAPAWYKSKSPAAQWAFGGKLVHITADGKGVIITKPTISGLEENKVLDAAIKTNDYKPLINQRLAKTIDETNEEDWNFLEKLSMDGKEEFLKEALSFDDEEEKQEETQQDEGEDFFANIEGAYEPKGSFSLESDIEKQVAQDVVGGNLKSAVAASLDNDSLLEAMIIALDSDDKVLKDSVKRSYFAKYGDKSSLTRFLFSISNNNTNDLVQNLEVSQWKYSARAIHNFYSEDPETKDEQLGKLADRLLQSGNRQDALILYLSANSLDKVAEVWLKESQDLEEKLQKQKESLHEAHSECLTEFIERFTVLARLAGDKRRITNEKLISKFMEYVNLASSSGSFDLAYSILDTLPADNQEVKMEKERVMLASGKSPKTSRKQAFGSTAAKPLLNNPLGNTFNSAGSSFAASASPMLNSFVNPQFPPSVSSPVSAPRANPYAPPRGSEASSGKYAPPASVSPVPVAAAAQNTFKVPANPYALRTPAATGSNQSSYAPLDTKPIPNFISSPPVYGETEAAAPPPPGMTSGQTPYLNKKANDGWNDLPLPVTERPSRAKAGSVAPPTLPSVPIGNVPGTPSNGYARPPLSTNPSSSSPLPPPPIRSSRVTSVSSTTSMKSSKVSTTNAYTQPLGSNTSTSRANPVDLATNALPPNPYAPSTATMSPKLGQPNPYAPPTQPIQTAASLPPNPYATATVPPAQPVAAQRPPVGPPPVGPPPTHSRKKTHSSTTVENASHLLESVQKKPDHAYGGTPTPPIPTNPPASNMAPPQPAAAAGTGTPSSSAPQGVPPDQQPIVDFLKAELARVAPLIPKEYSKQLKDCGKRLNILYAHLEKQDLLTQPTIEKLSNLVQLFKEGNYQEAMQVQVDIASNHPQEAGNWLTGVKRLIGISEAISN
ncbi:hypothetical protein HG536_0B04870 [Torulaspora globosa]|uniref:Protein transport protein SEC31 n=1 Tax=Torulaspora globosa TaxID=48254 RepID=A0A7G3ZDN7_9SACH|nr:uncharacterized protein HG536_0B04870 [Torulaspora globosa]QLL31623.1 hypothetical protein HG536_0B04870 [Torulaspora globosa]